jgi:hypothetical protein
MKTYLVISALAITLFVPLTTSAQDFCEGNFDYDLDQDGTDAAKFKEDFGRMEYDRPCPPDGPAPVEKTGQTFCANSNGDPVACESTGQDGEHQRGVEWPNPRFTNNGDGTITDNLTGLIWLRDADCSLFHAPRTWSDALNLIIPQLEDGYCGLSDGSGPGDWRLPNKRELLSLVHDGYHGPALPNTLGNGQVTPGDPFNNTQPGLYWSSTTYARSAIQAWCVDFDTGDLYPDDKDTSYYIWPVRGGH